MEQRPFGTTGLEVSALGLGAGAIGGDDIAESAVEELLLTALDAGITLFDTARSYGLSEERIGRYLSPRRDEFVLSTKGGYGVPGVPDWTPEAIQLGIDLALSTMRTDRIDVFHLHSCPRNVAMQEGILEALDRAREHGKIVVAAYAGEGDALAWSVRSGRFGSLQCSVNLFDQHSLEYVLPSAKHNGMGVIAKRAIGNAVWQMREWPRGDGAAYWERMQAMQLDVGAHDWLETALRFSAHAPGVSSALVGTHRVDHLLRNVELVEKGPLPEAQRLRICAAFQAKDRGWTGQV